MNDARYHYHFTTLVSKGTKWISPIALIMASSLMTLSIENMSPLLHARGGGDRTTVILNPYKWDLD